MPRVLCIMDIEINGVKLFKKGKIYKLEEENLIIDECGDRRIFCLYNYNNNCFKPISNKRRREIEKN